MGQLSTHVQPLELSWSTAAAGTAHYSVALQDLGAKTPNKAPQKMLLRVACARGIHYLPNAAMPAKLTGTSEGAPWCWCCGRESRHPLNTHSTLHLLLPAAPSGPTPALQRAFLRGPGQVPSTSEPIQSTRAMSGVGSSMSPLTVRQGRCSSPSSYPQTNYSWFI